MSQNSSETESVQEPRRGRRKKKLSQRAVDVIQAEGEDIPGISPGRAFSPANPFNDHVALPSTLRACPSAKHPNMANQSKIARIPLSKLKSMPVRIGADDYGLGPDQFAIYPWQYPVPKDFLDLSDSRKNWKVKIDRVEKGKDIDDGADEWENFDNSLTNRSIASCFVDRAKRSFWRGKSWKEFENPERGLNTQAVDAGGKPHPEALDNDRRMEIFEVIKGRLCEEIWLEPYSADLPEKDSKSPLTTDMAITSGSPNVMDNELRPSTEERADGIVRYTKNGEDAVQPWYEGEPINPSGLQNGIRYCQERYGPVPRASSNQTFQQEKRRQGRVVPVFRNIGASGTADSSAVEEIE